MVEAHCYGVKLNGVLLKDLRQSLNYVRVKVKAWLIYSSFATDRTFEVETFHCNLFPLLRDC